LETAQVFDAEQNDDADFDAAANNMGFTSIETLQQKALYLFGRVLARVSGKQIPEEIPENAEKYLSVPEVESILKDHGENVGTGFVIGGDTEEEMHQQLRKLLSALVDRVLSNVLSEGVKSGFLDFEFSTEKNDFVFGVTDLGKQLYYDGENYDADAGESENGG
jgi:hypothetical protein